MDKAKGLAAKAEAAIGSLDGPTPQKDAEVLFGQLGGLVYEREAGRAQDDTEAEIASVIEEIAALEASAGYPLITRPAPENAPVAAPPPPGAAAAGVAAPPPPGGATPPPAPPAPPAPAAATTPPPPPPAPAAPAAATQPPPPPPAPAAATPPPPPPPPPAE